MNNGRTALAAVLFLVLIITLGCSTIGIKTASEGDTVQVNYTGKLADGTVFDSSVGKQPLEFKIGSDTLIPTLEQAVIGMAVGGKKTITIAADDAYGPRLDNLVQDIPKEQFAQGLKLEVGQQLQSTLSNGMTIVVTVTRITDTAVTIDANHPLAGQDLTFEIELVKIL